MLYLQLITILEIRWIERRTDILRYIPGSVSLVTLEKGGGFQHSNNSRSFLTFSNRQHQHNAWIDKDNVKELLNPFKINDLEAAIHHHIHSCHIL